MSTLNRSMLQDAITTLPIRAKDMNPEESMEFMYTELSRFIPSGGIYEFSEADYHLFCTVKRYFLSTTPIMIKEAKAHLEKEGFKIEN